jgi:peptidoglycan/LPS O-acetylase OafA/YrhL
MRLDEAQQHRRAANNFDLLRLFAAMLVLFAHSFALTGSAEPTWKRTTLDGGSAGVLIFFSISGFLVSRSWSYDPRLLTFCGKRALRLMPALVVCLLLSALVLGPLVTTLSASNYLHDPATKRYVLDNATLQTNYTLPGVFDDVANPYPKIVNGSLWTLPLEVKAYFLVAVLGCLGAFVARRRWWLVVAAAAFCGLLLVDSVRNDMPLANRLVAFQADVQGGPAVLQQARLGTYEALSRYFAAFVIAAALFAVASRVTLRWRFVAALTAIWLASVIIGGRAAFFLAAWFAPYIVLTVAYRTAHIVKLPARVGDYSYGVYIYAFPVQQTIASVVGPSSGWVMFALAAPVTLGLAALSWRLIERPALTFKQSLAAPVAAATARAVHPAPRESLEPTPGGEVQASVVNG